jgi:uncharacterized protein YegL
MRRLPVYFLVDCSESMAGDALKSLSNGLDQMLATLKMHPHALDTVWISIITFSRDAKQILPLTRLMQVDRPDLFVRPGTALGAALKLLLQCIQREVVKTTPTTKADYKPLVFLITDGQPTDEWHDAASQIKCQHKPSIANIYAIGCGDDVDTDMLHEVTDIVLKMKDIDPEAWKRMCVWMSASVQSVTRDGTGGEQQMPPLPEQMTVAPESGQPRDSRPRQMFLHARCSKLGKPYLMRFTRRGNLDSYVALCSHPLEDSEEGDAGTANSIDVSLLEGCPCCPYCENPIVALCECGTLMCANGKPGEKTICPSCNKEGMLGDGSGTGGYKINTSEG